MTPRLALAPSVPAFLRPQRPFGQGRTGPFGASQLSKEGQLLPGRFFTTSGRNLAFMFAKGVAYRAVGPRPGAGGMSKHAPSSPLSVDLFRLVEAEGVRATLSGGADKTQARRKWVARVGTIERPVAAEARRQVARSVGLELLSPLPAPPCFLPCRSRMFLAGNRSAEKKSAANDPRWGPGPEMWRSTVPLVWRNVLQAEAVCFFSQRPAFQNPTGVRRAGATSGGW